MAVKAKATPAEAKMSSLCHRSASFSFTPNMRMTLVAHGTPFFESLCTPVKSWSHATATIIWKHEMVKGKGNLFGPDLGKAYLFMSVVPTETPIYSTITAKTAARDLLPSFTVFFRAPGEEPLPLLRDRRAGRTGDAAAGDFARDGAGDFERDARFVGIMSRFRHRGLTHTRPDPVYIGISACLHASCWSGREACKAKVF